MAAFFYASPGLSQHRLWAVVLLVASLLGGMLPTQQGRSCIIQYLMDGTTAATEEIGEGRKEVTQKIQAENAFGGDDFEGLGDAVAIEGSSGGQGDHGLLGASVPA